MDYIKVYVAVIIRVDELKRITPLSIIYEGRQYDIDKVVAVRRTPPEHVGGIITHRYDCKIKNEYRSLYHEVDGRWFVEVPLND